MKRSRRPSEYTSAHISHGNLATNFGFAPDWMQRHIGCYHIFCDVIPFFSNTLMLSHAKMNVIESLEVFNSRLRVILNLTSRKGCTFVVQYTTNMLHSDPRLNDWVHCRCLTYLPHQAATILKDVITAVIAVIAVIASSITVIYIIYFITRPLVALNT